MDTYTSLSELLSPFVAGEGIQDVERLASVLTAVAASTAQSVAYQESLLDRGALDRYSELVGMKNVRNNRQAAYSLVQVVTTACRRTTDKSTACPVNSAHLGKLLSFDDLVQLSAAHPTDVNLAKGICWCLAVLCADNTDTMTKCGESTAPAEIVRILTAFTNDADVCDMACRAVRNISAVIEDNARKLIDADISPALHSALVAHSDKPLLVESLAWALVNLSCDDKTNMQLGSHKCCAGAVNALVDFYSHSIRDASNDDWTSSGLPLALLWALRNMSCSIMYNLPILHNTPLADVLPALVDALASHGMHQCVGIGLHLMANLAVNSDLSQMLSAAGGCVTAGRSLDGLAPRLRTRMQEPDFDMYEDDLISLADSALAAIRNLSSGEEQGLSILREVRAPVLVMDVLHELYVEESHCVAALGALVNFMCDSPKDRAVLGRAGLGPLAVECLEKYPGSEPLTEIAAKAVAQLCMGSEKTDISEDDMRTMRNNRVAVKGAGFMRVITRNMHNLRYSEPAVRACCDALLHAHFFSCLDSEGSSDGASVDELEALRAKEACDGRGRAYIHDWTYGEVQETWLRQPSIVASVGEPKALPKPKQMQQQIEEQIQKHVQQQMQQQVPPTPPSRNDAAAAAAAAATEEEEEEEEEECDERPATDEEREAVMKALVDMGLTEEQLACASSAGMTVKNKKDKTDDTLKPDTVGIDAALTKEG